MKIFFLLAGSAFSWAIANPASEFCASRGGSQAPGIESCNFAPGVGIGAWTLWRHFHEKNKKQLAIEAYFGRLKNNDCKNQNAGVCVFSDGSQIEVETLKRGSADLKNSKLTRILNSRN